MIETHCNKCGKPTRGNLGVCFQCEQELPQESDDIDIPIGKPLYANRCVIIGPGAGANIVAAQEKLILGVGDVTILEVDMLGKSVVFRDKDGAMLLRAEWTANGGTALNYAENPDWQKRDPYNDIIDAFRMFVEAMEEGKKP